ncbi:hypothetical protein C8F04DRAFT_1323849 [Mycena alexandri]|uniref:Uncharacterized protein n=1 Tax=Mycena alexandri TaxID=1745969 RepID=A0AAD6X810_9AGAR|nr:hypothetical protein C8F04DRAFT_1323849 [Mycena alexandri]
MDSPNAGLSLSDSHPLSEELSSLRALVTRFQNEAHTASIKLQRHALDTSVSTERIAQLEAENALLKTELQVLRDNSSPVDASSASSPETVAELTLSLRRLSAKLSLTEEALAGTTLRLTQSEMQVKAAGHAAEQAYALAARARAREEEGRIREAQLERDVLEAREEGRLSDRVVGEYAALVRKLEEERRAQHEHERGHDQEHKGDEGITESTGMETGSSTTLVEPPFSPTTPGPVPPPKSPHYAAFFAATPATPQSPQAALNASKSQLHVLSATFAASLSALQSHISALEAERDGVRTQLRSAELLASELGAELGKARFEREKMRVEDGSAAGMVERYMKFTQQTTTALHASLGALRARHAATLATLHTTIERLTKELAGERTTVTRLRTVLDEAGGTILRESVGRRREVGLRIKMVGREEGVVGKLKGAVGRVGNSGVLESPTRLEEGGASAQDEEDDKARRALRRLVDDVRGVLRGLDADVGGPSLPSATTTVDGAQRRRDAGTEGRMRLLESAVEMLVRELEGEVGRRAGEKGAHGTISTPAGAPTALAEGDAPLVRVESGDGDIEGRTLTPTPEGAAEEGVVVTEGETMVVSEDGKDVRIEEEEEEEERKDEADADAVEEEDAGRVDEQAQVPEPKVEAEAEVEAERAVAPEAEAAVLGAEDDKDGTTAVSESLSPAMDAPPATSSVEEDPPAAPPVDIDSPDTDGTPDVAGVAFPLTPVEVEAAAPPPLAPAPVLPSTSEPVAFPSDPTPVSFPTSDPLPESTHAEMPTPSVAFPSSSSDDLKAEELTPDKDTRTETPTPTSAATLVEDTPRAPTPTHPLLADLAATSKRYDALQRAFRDCHATLQELRAGLSSAPSISEHSGGREHDVLQSAVERLHDYTEDARVELEIRVADGRVLARGWETIVGMPAANGSDAASSEDGHADSGGAHAHGDEADVGRQIAACVERDRVAQEGFQRKLEDVEHDIAVVKSVVYAPPSVDDASSTPPPSLPSSLVAEPAPSPISSLPSRTESWAAWLGGGGTRSRTPPSPEYADALTFGGVMTSPRLRHSASAARLAQHKSSGHQKHASAGNPFETLGLRVPMPAYVAPQSQAQAQTKQQAGGRQRTISGVYMLGLGVGGRGRVPSGLGVAAVPPVETNAGEGDVE